MNEQNLEVRGLRVGYDKNAVAEDISFSLAAGEVLASEGCTLEGETLAFTDAGYMIAQI